MARRARGMIARATEFLFSRDGHVERKSSLLISAALFPNQYLFPRSVFGIASSSHVTSFYNMHSPKLLRRYDFPLLKFDVNPVLKILDFTKKKKFLKQN